jgi:epoxide hydrolase-like predicted phosphatase
MSYRAVIFDLGGVVLGSPMHAIASYERASGLPETFINRVVADTAPHGGWAQLERGELTLEGFYSAFEADCRAAGHEISARTLMAEMAEATQPRAVMLTAIERIRAKGLAAAALTNNWISAEGGEDEETPGLSLLGGHFDTFIESSRVGLRKPDPRIYELVCRELEITPAEAVFLDDIGSNLKPARAMGMRTIRVQAPEQALDELEDALGFDLR